MENGVPNIFFFSLGQRLVQEVHVKAVVRRVTVGGRWQGTQADTQTWQTPGSRGWPGESRGHSWRMHRAACTPSLTTKCIAGPLTRGTSLSRLTLSQGKQEIHNPQQALLRLPFTNVRLTFEKTGISIKLSLLASKNRCLPNGFVNFKFVSFKSLRPQQTNEPSASRTQSREEPSRQQKVTGASLQENIVYRALHCGPEVLPACMTEPPRMLITFQRHWHKTHSRLLVSLACLGWSTCLR